MDKMQPNPLSHVPTAFVQDVLIKLAPRILAGADCLTVEEPQTDEAPFPPSLRCSLSPPSHLPQGYAIPPTHLLVLTFTDGDESSRTGGAEPLLRLMVPIQEAVWNLRCHTVARLVSSSTSSGAPSSPSSIAPSRDAADTFDLPVISFPGSLPFAAFSTFTVLHSYLHTATLPSALPSPDSRPGDDEDDDSSSFFNSDSDLEDEDEDIGFDDDDDEADDDEEQDEQDEDEEDPLLILHQRELQYEGLNSMCRAFGIDASDPIYEWLRAAAAAEERRCLRGADGIDERAALFATRKREVADGSVNEEDTSPSSWSHLPTPPPG